MTDQRFFPSLSTLIAPDVLPESLGFVQAAFDKLFYRNLQVHHSRYGDFAHYELVIVTYTRIGIGIPGGLGVFVNPPLTGDGGSEFPLSLDWRWEIRRYLADLRFDQVDFTPRALLDLLMRMARVNASTLIRDVATIILGGTLADFVTHYNNAHPTAPLAVTADPDDDVFLESILDALEAQSLDVIEVILQDCLLEANVDDTLAKVRQLFEERLGVFSEERLRRMLVPEVSASAGPLTIGVAFPSVVLREVNAAGNPVPDPQNPGEDKPAMATFDVASLRYSTATGFHFDVADSLNLSFPRCEILRTGLILEVHDLKVDFSRTTNIPEATADGRAADFVGVYVTDATVTLPKSWKPQGGTNAEIKARNLLIGTGGISGTLALEGAGGSPASVLKVAIGDFSVSLEKFQVDLKMNAVTGSVIEGTLVIPGFQDAQGNTAEIQIKASIQGNGDFDVAAHEDDGFRKIVYPGVFEIELTKVFLGKKEDDFYLGVTGSIRFTHDVLKNILKDPIDIEKLVIWSDGRFEIEGGTIPLPQNVRFPIGPAELSISAIHLGSHERTNADGTTTNFRYFGFDAAVDINPGGVDVRGKGIKFYFPINGNVLKDSYLEIKSIAIDLVIPGSASRETAQLLIAGYLSVGGTAGDPEYEGGVSFSLPKAKIAGGASMKYRPKVPAFLVDAFVELSVPIPLGSTSLGIYGFRGLFGLRYVASKKAVNLDDTKSWFDYYKVKAGAPLQEGISVAKFATPEKTGNYDSAFSVGAGVSLATVQDSGKTLSCKLFLLLSLPEVLYLEGKANILGERVGLTGEDPMFFALLAVSSKSIETGVGVTYKLPKDGDKKGQILDLSADMRAAFFFKNKRAWFIHMGTPENPTTARVLSLFDATSYLMLSASGIEAGAGVTYGFTKSYAGGMVRASVAAYLKLGGFISFQGPQIGGYIMLGGHVDASLMWFSFYITLDTSLSAEVPRPFYVEGSVHLCVGVAIGFWKFKKRIDKCFDVAFRWEKESHVPKDPVLPIADVAAGEPVPCSAMNMLSGETFRVAFFGSSLPSAFHSDFDTAVLPLDTWVDIEFLKGLIPSAAVDARIGRLSGAAPENAVDYVPPAEVAHRVKHQYTITAFEIRAWNGSAWVDYRPYQAMSPPDALTALSANPSAYKDGFWMNTGDGFNKIRLLSETSLSYMQQGQPGWYVPEEMGITGATLFCRGTREEERCIAWADAIPESSYPAGAWQQKDMVLYRVNGAAGQVLNWNGVGGMQRVLAFPNEASAELVLPKESARVRLKATTFAPTAEVRFSARTPGGFTLVESRTLTQLQLLAPVTYDDPAKPVAKIEIVPAHADPVALSMLEVAVYFAQRELAETGTSWQLADLQQQLAQMRATQCLSGGITPADLDPAVRDLRDQVAACGQALAGLQTSQAQACQEAHDFQETFVRCFPDVPSTLSYSIDDHFRLHDDRNDTVLFTSTATYASEGAAETALFDALALARSAGSYAWMNPAPRQFFFRLGTAATSPLFASLDELRAVADDLRATLQQPGFAPVRRTGGKLPCGPCAEHVECWDDIPIVAAYDEHCQPVATTTAHELFCSKYREMYRRLYEENKQKLDALTHRCEELTHALQEKHDECAHLGEQLAAAEAAAGAASANGPIRPPDAMPCSTLLQELCYLSVEDYVTNQTLPSQAAVEADYQNAVAAVAKMLTPIWRPHVRYAIRLQVMDTVDGTGTTPRDFYFGFRTAGPVGHFHNDPFAHYVEPSKPPEQYMLTGLKGYVDYRRSYPDPGGNIIGAKPLFYEDARILLFFTKRYVYHFFGPWPAYNGFLPIATNAMEIAIKDPAEKGQRPEAPVVWKRDEHPRIAEDVRTLVELRDAGGACWTSGGAAITPASVHTSVVPKYLKPLKLYTAIVTSVDGGAKAEVLSYVFQTSRYPTFAAQIQSYRLDDGKGNLRDAVFEVGVPLTPSEVNVLWDIVQGTMSPGNAALAGRWVDPFDRFVEGALAQKPLEPATGTELNLVRNTTTGAAVAVWIRNPEPFNDPKLPDDVLPRTLKVMAGLNPDPDYQVLFSRDRSQAIVMHPSRTFPVAQAKFRFAYVEWDGSAYIDHAVIVTGWIPTH